MFKKLFTKKVQHAEVVNDDRPVAFHIKYVGPSPYQKSFSGSGYGVVFEDDGETGYFYATDELHSKVFDAMLLYDYNTPEQVQPDDQIFIVWNSNLLKASIYYHECMYRLNYVPLFRLKSVPLSRLQM